MKTYEKPILVISEDIAEGVYTASGEVRITSSDANAYVNQGIGRNNGSLTITNPDLAGKNGTVTLRVSGIFNIHSSRLQFNGQEYRIGSDGTVSIYITGIKVNEPYTISILTGDVSVASTNSVDSGNIWIDIVG